MPVRMRCPECEKVLNIPDAARGKNVKCPQCEARIKVPTGKSGGSKSAGSKSAGSKSAPKQRPKRRPSAAAANDDGDIFDELDLRHAEDRKIQICPKCAQEVDEEDDECPHCGVDLETGVLSERQRKMRARKGPDPAEFYSVAWSNPFEYMLANWKICLKLGFVLAVCLSFALVCFANQHWCMARWIETVEDQASAGDEGVEIFERSRKQVARLARIDPEVMETPDQVRPYFERVYPLMCWSYEPALFWGAIGMMFYLCSYGWFWFVTLKIVEVTMEKRKPLETVKLDFFSTVALGIKAVVWPYVLVLPFVWFPPVWLLPLVAFPIAMVHFNQRYSYKAYLASEMTTTVFRMPGPTFYYLLVAFCVGLVHAAGIVTTLVLLGVSGVGPKFLGWTVQLQQWASENVWQIESEFINYVIWGMPSILLLSLAVFIPFFMTAGFPMVYVMRANGLLGKYFRPELELENQKPVGTPCGFWPRWLAYLIDGLVIFVLVFVYEMIILLALMLANKLGLENEAAMGVLTGDLSRGLTYGAKVILMFMFVGRVIFPILYFVNSEAGLGQATLGKRALKLVVVDMDGNRITKKVAVGRYLGKIISALPLLAGFFMAGWDQKKQALHDKMAKTMVVWRGDDETSN